MGASVGCSCDRFPSAARTLRGEPSSGFELELAATEETEEAALRRILEEAERQKIAFADPHVLVIRGKGQSLEPGTDLDLIRAGARNVRVTSIEAGAPQWYKVPDSKPCLALVGREGSYWETIELAKGRKMTTENLQQFVESALRARASGSLDLP